LVGDICLSPLWFFSLRFLSQIHEQMGSILGFWCSRVSFVFGGNPSIPLDSMSFGAP
jgi:hypothetical protein